MQLAIDWGTSFTKIGYLKEGLLINLVGPDAAVPTAVAYHPDSGLIFDRAALRLRDNMFTISQFKLELKRNPAFVLGSFDMGNLLKAYFNYLNQEYIVPAGEPIESVTIGVPNYFGLNARRLLLQVLKDCFGTGQVELMTEPAAAIIGYNLANPNPLKGEILSLDIGGGTCDFSFLSTGPDGYTVESQFQTGHDSFSGNEIDRAIVYNILWPEFVMQTGFSPVHFPLTGTMSPLQVFQYNRMLQSTRSIKLELGQQKEVYIHLPDFYASQALQMMLDQATFLARTRNVFDSLRAFIDTSVRSRAQALGLMNGNEWDIDGILLVGGASFTPGVNELLHRAFPRVPLILPEERSFNVLKGLAARGADRSRTCTLKTIYPFTFYIERFDAARQTSLLEKIPFDLQNLKIEMNQKYPLFTLERDTPFNLSPDPDYLNIRIYEGDAETVNLPERFSGRDLVLQVHAPKSALPEQMVVYLDLARAQLELIGRHIPDPNSAARDFENLLPAQRAWFNQLFRLNPNPSLMKDYRQHLESLQQNELPPFSGHDKSTLYKLYAMIDIFQNRK
jgi:molecular chaperone DnaK (HSP70)